MLPKYSNDSATGRIPNICFSSINVICVHMYGENTDKVKLSTHGKSGISIHSINFSILFNDW